MSSKLKFGADYDVHDVHSRYDDLIPVIHRTRRCPCLPWRGSLTRLPNSGFFIIYIPLGHSDLHPTYSPHTPTFFPLISPLLHIFKILLSQFSNIFIFFFWYFPLFNTFPPKRHRLTSLPGWDGGYFLPCTDKPQGTVEEPTCQNFRSVFAISSHPEPGAESKTNKAGSGKTFWIFADPDLIHLSLNFDVHKFRMHVVRTSEQKRSTLKCSFLCSVYLIYSINHQVPRFLCSKL